MRPRENMSLMLGIGVKALVSYPLQVSEKTSKGKLWVRGKLRIVDLFLGSIIEDQKAKGLKRVKKQ